MAATLAAAIDRRAAEMFAEDGSIALASWDNLAGSLRDEYRRLADAELRAESREGAR